MAGETVVRGILFLVMGSLCWGQERLVRVEFEQLKDLVNRGDRVRVLEGVRDQGVKIGAFAVDNIPGKEIFINLDFFY